MQHPIAISKTRKLKFTLILEAAAGTLLAAAIPAHAQRHDDSVTSREYRGSKIFDLKKDSRPTDNTNGIRQPQWILKNARLYSSYHLPRDYITYGPFRNNSPSALIISFDQVDKNDTASFVYRTIAAKVDGINTLNVANNIASASFTVPSGSEYTFIVRTYFSVSAQAINLDSVIPFIDPLSTGLPSAKAFNYPFVVSDYVTCTYKPGRERQTRYYYRNGVQQDGSNLNWYNVSGTYVEGWGLLYDGPDPRQIPAAYGILYEGPRLTQLRACDTLPVDPAPENNPEPGGGGPGDGPGAGEGASE